MGRLLLILAIASDGPLSFFALMNSPPGNPVAAPVALPNTFPPRRRVYTASRAAGRKLLQILLHQRRGPPTSAGYRSMLPLRLCRSAALRFVSTTIEPRTSTPPET